MLDIKHLTSHLVAACLLAVAPATMTQENAPDTRVTLALAGGRLLDGYGGPPLENTVILVAGQRNVAVGRSMKSRFPTACRS